MLKKINAARHEEVPGQIKRWNQAGGKALKGLERYRGVWEERFDRLEN
jgi:GH24 family phage-related lysozyme (muramidase)